MPVASSASAPSSAAASWRATTSAISVSASRNTDFLVVPSSALFTCATSYATPTDTPTGGPTFATAFAAAHPSRLLRLYR
eukprot:4015039-Prymnesium_polylepis.1